MKRTLQVFLPAMLGVLIFTSVSWAAGYHTLRPEQLKTMLNHKNFFLLDVHIPEQRHIRGTDAFVDFRRIRENADKLPADKNTKIVIYCLGDGMSPIAAETLIDMGYTQVYDLLGGSWAFNRFSAR